MYVTQSSESEEGCVAKAVLWSYTGRDCAFVCGYCGKMRKSQNLIVHRDERWHQLLFLIINAHPFKKKKKSVSFHIKLNRIINEGNH